MKRALIPVETKAIKKDEALELELELQRPGIVRDIIAKVEPSRIGGPPTIIPIFMVEIDPDAEKETRKFIIAPIMREITVDDYSELEYRGKLFLPDMMFCIFEEGSRLPSLLSGG